MTHGENRGSSPVRRVPAFVSELNPLLLDYLPRVRFRLLRRARPPQPPRAEARTEEGVSLPAPWGGARSSRCFVQNVDAHPSSSFRVLFQVTSSPCVNAGASPPHDGAFLFLRTLRTRLSPWVSYTSSTDLTSREPRGRCEARGPDLLEQVYQKEHQMSRERHGERIFRYAARLISPARIILPPTQSGGI